MALTSEQLREDLEFMFQTILEVHPKPDWRTPMADIEQEMLYARAEADSCVSVEQFWDIGTRFLHTFADGHTLLKMPGDESTRRVPVLTKLVDGQVVVEHVDTDGIEWAGERLEPGDAVLAVDGEEAGRRLNWWIRRQAFNTDTLDRVIAARFCLTFVGDTRTETELVVARTSGATGRLIVPVLPENHPAIRRADRDHKRRWAVGLVERTLFDDLRAGVLRYPACCDRTSIRSFIGENGLDELGLRTEDVPDFEEECWSLFDDIRSRGYTRLLIDLRGNTGGNPQIADSLFKYLMTGPLSHYCNGTKVSRLLVEQLTPHLAAEKLGTIRPAPRRWHMHFPYRSTLDADRLAAIQQFEGDIVVLTDGLTSSAGEWFAAILRANRIGTFIGEPTGEGGAVPGSPATVSLPNTSLTLHVSCMLHHMPEGIDDSFPGVLPDYYVRQTLDDFRAGRDTVMEFVKKMWA